MKIVVSTFLILLSMTASAGPEGADLKKFLKAELKAAKKTTSQTFEMNEEDRKKLKELDSAIDDKSYVFYFGRDATGKVIKACTVSHELGKEGPLQVGICYRPDGQVETVEILVWREDRAEGVKEPAYLSQFKGRKASEPLRNETDVKAVSGATVSSWAVTAAVRKANFVFAKYAADKMK